MATLTETIPPTGSEPEISTSRSSTSGVVRQRSSRDHGNEDNGQIAGDKSDDIELMTLPSTPRSSRSTITTTNSHQESPSPPLAQIVSRRSYASSRTPKNSLQRFWWDHISLSVEHSACRDHLALERTYLGYFRTSVLFATTGVFISQLYILQEQEGSSDGRADKVERVLVGKPLATTCFVMALWVIVWGTCRYWRFQRALAHGQALTGGIEVTLVIIFSFFLLISLFVINLVSHI